jgi:hypothetical protein
MIRQCDFILLPFLKQLQATVKRSHDEIATHQQIAYEAQEKVGDVPSHCPLWAPEQLRFRARSGGRMMAQGHV